MPQFLERRFNRQCAVYLAGISIIAYIFTKISVQLYAASVVLERVAGWPLWKTAVVLVIATGVYTIAGGLAAVIYTDTVQTLILIAGAAALTIIGLHRVGGLEHLRTMVPPGYFHMMKPASDSQFPWTGIFFGAPILGIWYWCTDQVIVQRVLSALGWTGDGGAAGGGDGRHEFGIQLRLNAGHAGFLQEDSATSE